MRRFSGLMLVLAAVLIGLATAGGEMPRALAQEATPAAASVVLAPDAQVAGRGLGEWSAQSWQWFFSLPADINPYFDITGEICGYGQSGPVFFLSGAEESLERSCVIPQGVHIFVPLFGSECSTVEPPPFFGRDEADLRRCAGEAIDHAAGLFDMRDMGLIVDGEAIADLSAYRTVTPVFPLWLPEENLLGSDRTVADSVADGYQVMLRPLALGEHEVVIAIPGPETITITYRLTVDSGTNAETIASPGATPSA